MSSFPVTVPFYIGDRLALPSGTPYWKMSLTRTWTESLIGSNDAPCSRALSTQRYVRWRQRLTLRGMS